MLFFNLGYDPFELLCKLWLRLVVFIVSGEMEPITTQLEVSAILFHLVRKPRVWYQMDQVLLRTFAKDHPSMSPDDVKTSWSNLPFDEKKDFVDDYALDISRGLGLALGGGLTGLVGEDFGADFVSDLADLEELEAGLD